jgi:L-ascorbate metabolism protein UlaG (beta-lactamase superfamily)
MGPDDAVKVFRDLRAKRFIPMHFGSFKLSFEDMDAPPRWLKEIAERDGLNDHIMILEEGVPVVL